MGKPDDTLSKEALLEHFIADYLPRAQVQYRLPLAFRIEDIWPELVALRRRRATILPLHRLDGEAFWYVPTEKLLTSGDRVAAMARREAALQLPQYRALFEDGLIDEAYFSSLIEGAVTTREEAKALIKGGKSPRDHSQRMILNNYKALSFVLETLEEPMDGALLVRIVSILTHETQEEVSGYRDVPVYVVSGRQETVYTPPPAERVPAMIAELLTYLAREDVHPVIKACVAHIMLVTIHPFSDGNGRTARALSYRILLDAGYDFFRQFPISGLLAQERPRYYKAIANTQQPQGGADLTYFIEYYTEMLARSVEALNRDVALFARAKGITDSLAQEGPLPQRLMEGVPWLLSDGKQSITAEIWREKWGTSFETARQDLLRLEKAGLLQLEVQGRKHIYRIVQVIL